MQANIRNANIRLHRRMPELQTSQLVLIAAVTFIAAAIRGMGDFFNTGIVRVFVLPAWAGQAKRSFPPMH